MVGKCDYISISICKPNKHVPRTSQKHLDVEILISTTLKEQKDFYPGVAQDDFKRQSSKLGQIISVT